MTFTDSMPQETGTVRADPLLLFDGECSFCTACVNFIARRDTRGIFSFAPLDSPAGKSAMHGERIPADRCGSLILIEHGIFYRRSAAVLKIAEEFRGWKAAASLLAIIPETLRDRLYSVIAQNRYKIFGKYSACDLPTAEWKNRPRRK